MANDKENNEVILEEEVKNETSTKGKKSNSKKNLAADKADEYIARLNNDLLEQKKLADEYYDSLKRNMADFDNYKKRIIKEKESIYVTTVSDIVENLLPVLDNFENALGHKSKDAEFETGMEMIYNQIKDVIKGYGVEEIKCLKSEFDPMLHEAVMHVDDETFGEKEVIEVFRKGYKIKDKVIRHAMVKVAN